MSNMDVASSILDVGLDHDHGDIAYYLQSNIEFGDAISQHLPSIALCLAITFVVRRQAGAGLIMLGASILLFRELFFLLAQQSSVYSILVGLGSGFILPLMYGTVILGFVFSLVGIMQPHDNTQNRHSTLLQGLNLLLLVSLSVELFVLMNRVSMTGNAVVVHSVQVAFHLFSLGLLLAVVFYRENYHSQLSIRAADRQRQMDALLTMFLSVKHDLNNDMQVVVGNAELTDIMINTGGDIQKPLNNITNAATIAIDRIEQLSVFNTSSKPTLSAVDLNATLRESTERLRAEIPPTVSLQMELEHLPVLIMADRHLLSLSLINLLTHALKSMERGGEIIINTQDQMSSNTRAGSAVVCAEVSIVLTRNLSVGDGGDARSGISDNADSEELEKAFGTAKSLVERSGAISVTQTMSPNGYLISMDFVSESAFASNSSYLRYAYEYSGCQH